MKRLPLFLLIAACATLSACSNIDYIYFHKIEVVNNTESVITMHADTMLLTVNPGETAMSDFDFGDQFLWGWKSSFDIADSTITLHFNVNYMSLHSYFTENEYETRHYINTFEIDDDWVRRLWTKVQNTTEDDLEYGNF